MDGIYILQTIGKQGPEYRVTEFEDVTDLVRDNSGKFVRDKDVLKTNVRRRFADSKVFNNGEEAVNYATMMLTVFKEQGIEFNNGIKIMPPMDFEF